MLGSKASQPDENLQEENPRKPSPNQTSLTPELLTSLPQLLLFRAGLVGEPGTGKELRVTSAPSDREIPAMN